CSEPFLQTTRTFLCGQNPAGSDTLPPPPWIGANSFDNSLRYVMLGSDCLLRIGQCLALTHSEMDCKWSWNRFQSMAHRNKRAMFLVH
ncbi:hypothetical protein XENOCAPTIV_013562, partial [Xenoophorus captivus]